MDDNINSKDKKDRGCVILVNEKNAPVDPLGSKTWTKQTIGGAGGGARSCVLSHDYVGSR